jgi:hypothetical protein
MSEPDGAKAPGGQRERIERTGQTSMARADVT